MIGWFLSRAVFGVCVSLLCSQNFRSVVAKRMARAIIQDGNVQIAKLAGFETATN